MPEKALFPPTLMGSEIPVAGDRFLHNQYPKGNLAAAHTAAAGVWAAIFSFAQPKPIQHKGCSVQILPASCQLSQPEAGSSYLKRSPVRGHCYALKQASSSGPTWRYSHMHCCQ